VYFFLKNWFFVFLYIKHLIILTTKYLNN